MDVALPYKPGREHVSLGLFIMVDGCHIELQQMVVIDSLTPGVLWLTRVAGATLWPLTQPPCSLESKCGGHNYVLKAFVFLLYVSVLLFLPCLILSSPLPGCSPQEGPPYELGPAQSFFLLKGSFSCHCCSLGVSRKHFQSQLWLNYQTHSFIAPAQMSGWLMYKCRTGFQQAANIAVEIPLPFICANTSPGQPQQPINIAAV